jgi:hypothetical protein
MTEDTKYTLTLTDDDGKVLCTQYHVQERTEEALDSIRGYIYSQKARPKPFTAMVLAVLCGNREFDDAFNAFCDERGIEEGAWSEDQATPTYEDWTNGHTYTYGID